jgi:hypothetical protein
MSKNNKKSVRTNSVESQESPGRDDLELGSKLMPIQMNGNLDQIASHRVLSSKSNESILGL